MGVAEPALRNECVQRKGGGRFPAGKTSRGALPEWQQPRKPSSLPGIVVARISSPGYSAAMRLPGLPVNGIYPLIPIQ